MSFNLKRRGKKASSKNWTARPIRSLERKSIHVLQYKKAAIEFEFPAWLIISLIVGAVAIIGIFILKGKISGAIDYIRNILG